MSIIRGHGGAEIALTTSDIARLFNSAERVGDCLIWRRHIRANGYGRFRVRRVEAYAHRAAFTAAWGQIPADLTVDHLCSTRARVDPNHMELVTRGENTRRAFERAAA